MAGACLLLALVGGCASGPRPAYPDNAVALRVEISSSGSALSNTLRVPELSVYYDGSVLTEAAHHPGDPYPAIPTVLRRHISRADVDRLVHMARAAGVGTAPDLRMLPISDGADTIFTLHDTAGVATTPVYELGAVDDFPSVTREQRDARAKLEALYKALGDLPATLGPGAVSAPQPYSPQGVAVLATPWNTDEQFPDQHPDIAWPGPPLPGPRLQYLNCLTVTGADLARVLPLAGSTTGATAWVSAGTRWAVGFRPLLPDESSCTTLG